MRSLDWVRCVLPEARRALGVFISDAEVFLVDLERDDDGRFLVRQARADKIQAPAGALWESPESLAENLARLCVTYGLAYDNISVCLPRELFFVYERTFPPMGREELTAAAYWDIETNVPFAEGAYWPGFGAHDEQIELAALPTEYGRALVEAMTSAGLSVEALTMEPLRFTYRRENDRIVWRDMEAELSPAIVRADWTQELSTALYAAFRFYRPSVGVEFLPASERGSNLRLWQAGGNAIFACTLVAALLFLVWNLVQISAADARIEELRQEYALESRERQNMATFADGHGKITGAEGLLQGLSRERLSWYAVFSALGATTVDGVYLTEFDVQESGAILCSGRAPNHARLVEYLDRLEREETTLREKPSLQDSAADERGEIHFKVRLRF